MKKALITIVISFIALAVILVLHSIGALRFPEMLFGNAISFIGGPIYQAKNWVGSTAQKYICTQDQTLSDLQKEVETLREEHVQLQQTKEENERLRTQLDFLKTEKGHHILANVIGKSQDTGTSGIIIDKGSNNGLQIGYPVIIDHGVIIGKISSVQQTNSHVLLLNDSRSKLLVSALLNSKATGVLEGQFGLGMQTTLIPTTEQVTPNDLIITTGLENNVPSGLIVGTIRELHRKDTDLFATADVKPETSYEGISIVTILLP